MYVPEFGSAYNIVFSSSEDFLYDSSWATLPRETPNWPFSLDFFPDEVMFQHILLDMIIIKKSTYSQSWEFIKENKKENTLYTKKKKKKRKKTRSRPRKNDNGQEKKERKHALDQ